MHIAVNTKTAPFPVTVYLPHPSPLPHNQYFCSYHTLWLEETTLFSLAIKAKKQLSKRGRKNRARKREKEKEKNKLKKGRREGRGEQELGCSALSPSLECKQIK